MPIYSPILVIVIVLIIKGFNIAREYERGVVFRLGRFFGLKGPGLYWIIPFVDQRVVIDLRTNTVNIEQQESVTRDSVTIKVNAVLWFKVTSPEKAVISVANYREAVYQLALTTLRNIIGQHDLDEILKERDKINTTIQKNADAVTSAWGIQVEMVEMKDVEIPEAMQRAMAREAEAIRERRARVIKAEAEKDAAQKLSEAAQQITANPLALELRRMQMLTEIGAENNTTTVLLFPSDFLEAARSYNQSVAVKTKQ